MPSTTVPEFLGRPRAAARRARARRVRLPPDRERRWPPGLSIDIGRELATVVVALEGVRDEDSSSAFVELLRDLVIRDFEVLEREAALRGGTLAVVVASPPLASAEKHRKVAVLDHRRARRAAALGMAGHPAGSARPAQPDRRQVRA